MLRPALIQTRVLVLGRTGRILGQCAVCNCVYKL